MGSEQGDRWVSGVAGCSEGRRDSYPETFDMGLRHRSPCALAEGLGGALVKRDMDLIRALLLNLESSPMERGDNVHIQPDDPKLSKGCSVDQIDYHLDLLMKAGF